MIKKYPHYKRLHADLKQDIVSGIFRIGSLLPSENALSSKYNITRATVRQALDALVKEGFIKKKMGMGSVVVSNRKTLGLLSFKGFSEVTETAELDASSRIISFSGDIDKWPDPFFYPLSKKEFATGCYVLERLRVVEHDPVMHEITYLPSFGLATFPAELINNSLFTTLQMNFGIEIVQVMQDLRAIHADDQISQKLNIDPTTPLIHIYRKYTTNKDQFHIYSSLYCNTVKYTLSNFFN